jgi:hypothetical protein
MLKDRECRYLDSGEARVKAPFDNGGGRSVLVITPNWKRSKNIERRALMC